MKLSDWVYFQKDADDVNKATRKHLDKEVVKEYTSVEDWDLYMAVLEETTFTQQHLFSFVELEDGTLVGHNESPTHGWSFPTAKWKEE